MEPFSVDGKWWLPGHFDERMAGTLTFDPDDGGSLKVFGSFRKMLSLGTVVVENGVATRTVTSDDLSASGSYDRILGQSGKKYFTLENCFRTSLNDLFMSDHSFETIYVNEVYQGALFDSTEPVLAQEIETRLQGMSYWVNRDGSEETMVQTVRVGPTRSFGSVTLTADHLPPLRFTAGERLGGMLSHHLSTSGDYLTGRRLKQSHTLRVRSAGLVDPEVLFKRAIHFQHLVSIGLDLTATTESIEFGHPAMVERHKGAPRPWPIPLKFYARLADRETQPTEAKIHRHDMLFNLDDVGGPDGISRWMPVANRHDTALGRVMSTRYRRMPFGNDRLLNRAAALEAYDRKHHPGLRRNFAKRMNYCIDTVGDPFIRIVHDRAKFVKLLAQQRDDTAHHLDRSLLASNDLDHPLADAAYYLFVFCLLKEAGLPDSVFDRAKENQRLIGVRRDMREVVASY